MHGVSRLRHDRALCRMRGTEPLIASRPIRVTIADVGRDMRLA